MLFDSAVGLESYLILASNLANVRLVIASTTNSSIATALGLLLFKKSPYSSTRRES